MSKRLLAGMLVLSAAAAAPAQAGVYILDGTDSDDHGSATATANEDGWLYIQKALEALATSSSLTRPQRVIAALGADPGTTAAQALQSSVNLSSILTSAGWTVNLINNAELTNFFNGSGTVNTSNVGMLYIPSSSGDVFGGISGSEEATLTTFATQIDAFLGSGGGLLSHTHGYGWLSALVPGLTVVDDSDTGITLTAAGNANFPGLTNADLSTGPYHNYFTNTGPVPVLGVGEAGTRLAGRAVIIGGVGGSVTNPGNPGAVPEPATWAMMLFGFGAVGYSMRSRKVGYKARRAV
jgi:hypothetical protein